MSRHRKIKALNYDDEYDDYYGDDFDEDDAFDEEAFESKYLSSGIDLTPNNKSSNICGKPDENLRLTNEVEPSSARINLSSPQSNMVSADQFTSDSSETKRNDSSSYQQAMEDSIDSGLTKLAIQHLDKYQWQLPLMDMDKKFRDRTYFKHYTDTYISSLRSTLGQFLTDNHLIGNPMNYHLQQELDNYTKYSKMSDRLVEYYQSIGKGFFSFSTPSPDEEIVIGCRLGTKVKPKAAQQKLTKIDQQKTPRFEYHGKPSNKPSATSSGKANKTTIDNQQLKPGSKSANLADLTVSENFTAEQLDKLSKEYKDSLKIESRTIKYPKSGNLKVTDVKFSAQTDKTKKKPSQPIKPIATLTEKRNDLRQQIKRGAQPSAQEREAFKKMALQTTKEYDEFVKSNMPQVNLIVVGHVDAGKSTLVGHLLTRLGHINNKQMHRLETDSQRSGKSSFKFAWAMDETEEERARGVTIDIAQTQFRTANREVIILDAPGHVDFIPAVISGATQADAAILVVDATRGEFETGFQSGGQTREHTLLVRSLGVKSLIVAVNKMDNVDWSWSRFNDISDQLKPFLKQVGFNMIEDVQFVVCSGLTGENLIDRRMSKVKKLSSHPQLEGDGGNWNEMTSLLEAVDKIRPPERAVDKPVRVCITDLYKGMSNNASLGGKVVSGRVANKQKLKLLPANESCEVKQVEVRGSKSDRAFAGDIVTLVTTGIDLNKFYRGSVLCDPVFSCQVTNRFQARVILFQNIGTVIIKGAPIEIHINGTYESGQVRKLVSLLNKSTGELIAKKPRCLVQNSSAIVQFKLDKLVCCELYEDNKELGRFMVRSYGKTIAAGLITKIKSPKMDKTNKTKMKSK